jgi:hypothetical protein
LRWRTQSISLQERRRYTKPELRREAFAWRAPPVTHHISAIAMPHGLAETFQPGVRLPLLPADPVGSEHKVIRRVPDAHLLPMLGLIDQLAWMVRPILRLGYRTATLPAALRTRLAGGEERMVSMIAWASLNSPRRSHSLASSCAESILPGARMRFRQHDIPGGHSTGSPYVKNWQECVLKQEDLPVESTDD